MSSRRYSLGGTRLRHSTPCGTSHPVQTARARETRSADHRPCRFAVLVAPTHLSAGEPCPPRTEPGIGSGVRAGDTLVVSKLDRLARSVPDAQRNRRRPRRPRHQTVPRRADLRPHRPHGQDVLQHPRHLRRIRSRPTQAAHSRRHGRRPRERPASRADNPRCPSSSRKNFAACTAPATTPSPTSPNCSRSPDRPCIAHWQNRTRPQHPCSRRLFSQARCVALFLHRMDRRPRVSRRFQSAGDEHARRLVQPSTMSGVRGPGPV